MFRGTYTALVTPFRDGRIDAAAFEKLIEGQIAAALEGERVTLQMSEPKDLQLNLQINALGETIKCHYVDSGVPHVVVPVAEIAKSKVRELGSALRHHEKFSPRGANVNFLERRGPQDIAIRTYERGVEDETLACGTGVVASALIFAATEKAGSPFGVLYLIKRS